MEGTVQLVNNVNSTNTSYLRSKFSIMKSIYNDKKIITDNTHLLGKGRDFADLETISEAVANFNTVGNYVFFANISPKTTQLQINEIKAKVGEIIAKDSVVMLVMIGSNNAYLE
jgi:hypothetical protein